MSHRQRPTSARVAYRDFFLCRAILWPLAGEPTSLPQNFHIELALIIVVRRINLFELIEHKVNVTCVAPSKRIDAISSLKPANID
jgi:hypothetical protein